jgi:hypothetical protein
MQSLLNHFVETAPNQQMRCVMSARLDGGCSQAPPLGCGGEVPREELPVSPVVILLLWNRKTVSKALRGPSGSQNLPAHAQPRL